MSAPIFLLVPDSDAVVREGLSSANRDWVAFSDVPGAVRALPTDLPDLFIVDADLPGVDVLATIRATRQVSECLLLLVSDSRDEVDCILALEFGADGYLARPFSARQLAANVQALLRRAPKKVPASEGREESITYRTLFLDLRKGSLRHACAEVSLTLTELAMARLMMAFPSRVFRRDELLNDNRVKRDSDSRAVDVHIGNLRKKIASLDLSYTVLHSVKGRGYRFG